MFWLYGQCDDGTTYEEPARNEGHFFSAIKEIEADPIRNLPNLITGTRAPERLPKYLTDYIKEHDADYIQDPAERGRKYNLYIRRDPEAPEGFGGMISHIGSKTVIFVNANDSPVEQLSNFLHEATHLWRDDLNRSGQMSAAEIEEACDADLTAACRFILEEHEYKQMEE